MTSSAESIRVRKRPEDRRAEILAAASAIALEEGLERITLRAVADRLGVRPGLITHYFPLAESLVVEAFERACILEREHFFPRDQDGDPLARLSHFVRWIESGASVPLAAMWLNARHLSRFSPALRDAISLQDALDRARLSEIIADGIAEGVIPPVDAEFASIRILLAVDGSGSCVNSATDPTHPAHRRFILDVAEWTLGLAAGTLRASHLALGASPPRP